MVWLHGGDANIWSTFGVTAPTLSGVNALQICVGVHAMSALEIIRVPVAQTFAHHTHTFA